jgi:hypothetical protein
MCSSVWYTGLATGLLLGLVSCPLILLGIWTLEARRDRRLAAKDNAGAVPSGELR